MKSVTYIFQDQKTGVQKTLFKLESVKKHDCVVFIDYSVQKSHVTFHEDNSVWITPHGDRRSRRVFSANSGQEVASIKKDLIYYMSPFLIYRPLSFVNYPVAREKDTKSCIRVIGDACDLPKSLIIPAILYPTTDSVIPQNIVDITHELGIFKIGAEVTMNFSDGIQASSNDVRNYTPIRFGSHLLHTCIARSPEEPTRIHGAVIVAQLYNRLQKPSNFLVNTDFTICEGFPPSSVFFRYSGVNGTKIAEIVFNPPSGGVS